MATNQAFHTRTALAEGLRELFKQLEARLSLRSPMNVYLAGGMAVHLYTATRVTTDVDAEFGGRDLPSRRGRAAERRVPGLQDLLAVHRIRIRALEPLGHQTHGFFHGHRTNITLQLATLP